MDQAKDDAGKGLDYITAEDVLDKISLVGR
jgi:hypothetical protein